LGVKPKDALCSAGNLPLNLGCLAQPRVVRIYLSFLRSLGALPIPI
jgi:hypothetical protein